jgi:hypothetical protein
VVGSLINDNSWNWGTGIVYPPVWPGYPAYRPGLRPGGNVNIGNEINIGGNNNVVSGNNIVGNSKPWRPDPDRYRPGQGTKPGLASVNRPERPTSPDRPGMGTGRPSGIADRPARIDRPSADRPSVDRPAGAGANRPGPAAGTGLARPTPGIGTAVARPSPPAGRSDRAGDRGQRPVTREAPGPSVFGGADLGRGASLAAERGAASRAQVTSRAGGGAAVRPVAGRGGGAAMGAGGGRAGGGAMRGGGPGHR